MAPFSIGGFLKDIKHVDKDLRLMALFDLQRHLPSANEGIITNDVVDEVLLCLSSNERCEEVQNEAANVLPGMVVMCAQRDVIFQYLLSSTTKMHISDDSDSANLQYLAGMTFKKCCAEFASEARRNVAFWQKQIDVARHLCASCSSQLDVEHLKDTARETLYVAVNALVLAYRDVLDERDVLIKQAVRDFQKTNSIRHASLTLVESLLACVKVTTQESVVAESLKLLLTATSSEQYVTYLQLCEVEMRAMRSPPLRVVQQVVDSVCKRLAHATEQYDEGEDSTETLLEVVCYLVQLNTTDGAPSWSGIFAALRELATFDPYPVGLEEDAYANGDDYDNDYDEYDKGASDSTWKLRIWAARILQMLVIQHDDKDLGMQSLNIVEVTLQDRVQSVQLEAVKLVRTVARCSYVRDADCVALITSRCSELCMLIGSENDKLTVSVVRTLQDIFVTMGDAALFSKTIVPLLLSQVRAHFSAFATSAVVIEGLRSIVASVVRAKEDGELRGSEIVDFAKELPALCLCGGRSSNIEGCIVKVSDTLAQVYEVTQDTSVLAIVGSSYCALLDNDSFPGACRAAAAEGLANWAAAYGFSSLEQPLTSLWRALRCDEMKLPVLRALSIITNSSASSCVPISVLEEVAALIESESATVRAASVNVLLRRLASPNTAPLASPFLQKLTTFFAPDQPLSLTSCDLTELCSRALFLAQLFMHQTERSVWLYETYLKGVWGHVAQLANAVQWSRRLLEPVLDSLTRLVTIVYERDTVSRSAIEEAVREFWLSNQSHMPCICTVVRCIAATSASAASTFLHSVAPQLVEKAHLLLCVGEVGQTSILGVEWSELLLGSVQSKEGELVRSCGERSLSFSMLNPGNFRSLLLPCGERATSAGTVGRYYYVKSIKEAVSLALTRQCTAFHDSAVSKFLLNLFLQSSPTADLVEMYGACAGILSVFVVSAERGLLIADSLFDREAPMDTRVTCMVALRFFLGAMAERSASIETYQPTVVRALLQLHRPTDAKESTAPSLPLRFMALRLFIAVLERNPHWLVCEETRTTIFPNLLAELREDAKLQGTFDLSGYTHRVDKGLECRKLAFESLSAVFWTARQRNVDLVKYCEAENSVVSALVIACSSHASGDRESSINDTAKDLLLQFLEGNPTFILAAPQLDCLVSKLSHDIKWGASPTDAQKTTLLYTIRCVMKLSCHPLFAYHTGFQEVAEVARRSPLLAQSLKL